MNLWCVNGREIGLTFNGYMDAEEEASYPIHTAVQEAVVAICHRPCSRRSIAHLT